MKIEKLPNRTNLEQFLELWIKCSERMSELYQYEANKIKEINYEKGFYIGKSDVFNQLKSNFEEELRKYKG